MEKILEQALKRRGMTQKELAEAIHVTPQAVSKWMTGKSRPSSDSIIEINNVLGIDLIKEMTKKYNSRSNRTMNHLELKDLSNYDLAKKEAVSILSEAHIKTNYSYPVCILCEWLLTAVIGLTYHQMINSKDEDVEVDYQNIFNNLDDYFECECFNIKKGLYENYLEHSFFEMGADLFESFDEYKLINHDYCQASMNEWYLFKKSIQKSASSPIYNELMVALSEIINLFS